MTLEERVQDKILLFDGAMGTMLQGAISPGSPPELLNLEKRDLIKGIHAQYLAAGCDIIETNTFGGNRIKLAAHDAGDLVRRVNEEGAALAREAAGDKYVAGAIGPTGKFLEPWGELSFFQARDIFAEQAAALAAGGADCIIIETMTDLQEARAALLGAREATSLPIIAQMSFASSGRTMGGTDPGTAGWILARMGAWAVGSNCGVGSEQMVQLIGHMIDVPAHLSALPNAGMPRMEGGKTVYPETPGEMAQYVEDFVDLGINLLGSCCGSSPDHTRALKGTLGDRRPVNRKPRRGLVLAGMRSHTVLEAELPVAMSELNGSLDRVDWLQLGEAMAQTGDLALWDLRGSGRELEGLIQAVDAFQLAGGSKLAVAASDPQYLEGALARYAGLALACWSGEWDENPDPFLSQARRFGAGVLLPGGAGLEQRIKRCQEAGFARGELAVLVREPVDLLYPLEV
ncbi:MAG: homocysteine S-methyltransferase family protein [Limnochordia bacterium]|nr:hypothetical protein [Bacillota bacterium]